VSRFNITPARNAIARLPLPARHSPEAKPMADGQGTSGQACEASGSESLRLGERAGNVVALSEKLQFIPRYSPC